MGGYGSGKKTCKKTTVEECLKLRVKSLVRAGRWQDGQVGTITWTWGNDGQARIGFRLDLAHPPRIWLNYTITKASGEKQSYDYAVGLDSEPCKFGGRQWYYRCPGAGCGRRVRMLHKPPDAGLFACRDCHKLTYISAQEHDHRVKAFREDPHALQRVLNGSAKAGELLLAMKALA